MRKERCHMANPQQAAHDGFEDDAHLNRYKSWGRLSRRTPRFLLFTREQRHFGRECLQLPRWDCAATAWKRGRRLDPLEPGMSPCYLQYDSIYTVQQPLSLAAACVAPAPSRASNSHAPSFPIRPSLDSWPMRTLRTEKKHPRAQLLTISSPIHSFHPPLKEQKPAPNPVRVSSPGVPRRRGVGAARPHRQGACLFISGPWPVRAPGSGVTLPPTRVFRR